MRWFLIPQCSLQCIGLGVRCKAQMLVVQLPNFLSQCIEAGAFFVNYWSTTHESRKRTVRVFNPYRGGALTSFDDYFDLTVFLFLRLQNPPESPDTVNLF